MISNYYIKTINQIDKKEWKSFIQEHPNGNIFQSPIFYDIYENTQGYKPITLFAIDNFGNIVGILQGFIIEDKLSSKIFKRSIIWGGPLIKGEDTLIANLLIKTYVDKTKKKVVYSEVRNVFCVNKYQQEFINNGFIYKRHLNFLFDLSLPENDLWQNVHKNRKKEIKKGIRKGTRVEQIEVSKPDSFNKIYDQLSQLYKRRYLPLPSKGFFRNAFRFLSADASLKTFGAFYNEELIGFRIVLLYKNTIYDWYAASNNKYLNYRPNDILPWEIIKWGRKESYKYFNFGGAGSPEEKYGVRDYKSRFGGTLVEYGRYLIVNNKSLMLILKKLFKIRKKLV